MSACVGVGEGATSHVDARAPGVAVQVSDLVEIALRTPRSALAVLQVGARPATLSAWRVPRRQDVVTTHEYQSPTTPTLSRPSRAPRG